MSRRRYISTGLGSDKRLGKLAEKGPWPLLLYTWAKPHCDDWGRMSADPYEFKMLVCPGLDITEETIDEALTLVAEQKLWQRYEIDGESFICIDSKEWFDEQSYINKGKREKDVSKFPSPPSNNDNHRKTPQNTEEQQEKPNIAEEQQETPENTASPSLTPSPSPSPSLSKGRDVREEEKDNLLKQVNALKIRTNGAYELDQLFSYLGHMDYEVVLDAIKRSEKKAKLSYALGILSDRAQNKLYTISDLKKAGEINEAHGRDETGSARDPDPPKRELTDQFTIRTGT
jgi:predicted  nucleic acid-binding Zn-ribbon protein